MNERLTILILRERNSPGISRYTNAVEPCAVTQPDLCLDEPAFDAWIALQAVNNLPGMGVLCAGSMQTQNMLKIRTVCRTLASARLFW